MTQMATLAAQRAKEYLEDIDGKIMRAQLQGEDSVQLCRLQDVAPYSTYIEWKPEERVIETSVLTARIKEGLLDSQVKGALERSLIGKAVLDELSARGLEWHYEVDARGFDLGHSMIDVTVSPTVLTIKVPTAELKGR